MAHFADLRNDFVFRRIFGKHPDLLAALLNDLLGREGEAALSSLVYLGHASPDHAPAEQPGAQKLSIVDLTCRDPRGTVFLVELQAVATPGFLKRAVYRASRTFIEQLERSGGYDALASVIAVSICDFEVWPDRDQDALRAPRVPMLSRWRMTELDSGAEGPSYIEHVFLELPKLGSRLPESGAELWAWLFLTATDHHKMPEVASSGPYKRALELAIEAAFTAPEMEAYQRAREELAEVQRLVKEAEVRGRREGMMSGRHEGLVQGKRDGLLEGEIKGRREALREVLLRWIDWRGLVATAYERARIEGETSVELLARWSDRVVGARSMAEVFGDEGSA